MRNQLLFGSFFPVCSVAFFPPGAFKIFCLGFFGLIYAGKIAFEFILLGIH
jgi:hypothetical protein